MTAAEVVLLEFYGAPPGYDLAGLAAGIGRRPTRTWDVLDPVLLAAPTLAAVAAELVARDEPAGEVVVVGSCFGAPLAALCAARLRDKGVVATSFVIDPEEVDDAAVAREVGLLGARVGAAPYEGDLTGPGWRDAALAHLCGAAEAHGLAAGWDPDEAAAAAAALGEQYDVWLRYLGLCRDAGAVPPTHTALSAPHYPDTAGLLASEELSRRLLDLTEREAS